MNLKPIILMMALASISAPLFAVCEHTLLNKTDIILKSYSCTSSELNGAAKINDLCIVSAKTDDEDGFKYTHIQTYVLLDDDTVTEFSTFKWHHKKNNNSSKRRESKKRITMKDVTSTNLLTINVHKTAHLNKESLTAEIEVYKKKVRFGIRKRPWYSANFNCTSL